MSKLGSFLKQERDRRGWSKTDLSAKSGVPLATLSRYESARYRGKPSHPNILLLAAAFELSPQQLLGYIGYPIRDSKNGEEQNARWRSQRALLESDPRAVRILELYDSADDEGRDTSLSLLELHLTRPRRRRSG